MIRKIPVGTWGFYLLVLAILTLGPSTYTHGDNSAAPGTRAALSTDVNVISARQGGVVNFSLDAGVINSYRLYVMCATTSGNSPGTILPSGVTLPINWDYFSTYVMINWNTPTFHNFVGPLDLFGKGSAQFNTTGMGPVSAGCIGKVLSFAFVTTCYWDFVSNPVDITIIP